LPAGQSHRQSAMRILTQVGAALGAAACFLTGCGESPKVSDAPKVPAKSPAPAPVVPIYWNEVKVHEAIRSKNPGYSGNGQFEIDPQGQVVQMVLDNCNVADLSPLAGMDLKALALLNCPVTDISAIKGMGLIELYLEKTPVKEITALAGNTTLQKLYLSSTGVTDLSPLKGLPIMELNLVETFVKDLSPLAQMPIKMLWLTGSPIEDIAPLRSCPLVSLTLHRTLVSDLSPLSGTALQRLHIGETPVKDLTPLAGMNLTRLVFDQAKIEKGLDEIKQMRSLQEIGSEFVDGKSNLVPPAVYWGKAEGE
jgi:internalin A